MWDEEEWCKPGGRPALISHAEDPLPSKQLNPPEELSTRGSCSILEGNTTPNTQMHRCYMQSDTQVQDQFTER
ncbi:hypothetical protein EYF80_030001 [Liparis tanakae]|uniref:Uncharacterized protein n=1 Tax=Liparis tanakae TaxID=230148 RepID=A0A4Z2H205_9TELE|nr:hypothetical protein EYF80_030001 [Liparis tanakae]